MLPVALLSFRSFQDAGLFQHTFSKDLSKHKLLNLMLFELFSMLCPMWEPISSSMMARAALKGHENYAVATFIYEL